MGAPGLLVGISEGLRRSKRDHSCVCKWVPKSQFAAVAGMASEAPDAGALAAAAAAQAALKAADNMVSKGGAATIHDVLRKRTGTVPKGSLVAYGCTVHCSTLRHAHCKVVLG